MMIVNRYRERNGGRRDEIVPGIISTIGAFWGDSVPLKNEPAS